MADTSQQQVRVRQLVATWRVRSAAPRVRARLLTAVRLWADSRSPRQGGRFG